MENLRLKNGAIFIADAHENEQRRGFWAFLEALNSGNLDILPKFSENNLDFKKTNLDFNEVNSDFDKDNLDNYDKKNLDKNEKIDDFDKTNLGDFNAEKSNDFSENLDENSKNLSKAKTAENNGKFSCEQLILMGDIFDVLVGEVLPSHDFAKPYIKTLESLANRGLEVIYIEGNHDFNLAPLFEKVKVISLENQPVNLDFAGNLCLKKAKFRANSSENSKQSVNSKGEKSTSQNLEIDENFTQIQGISGIFLAHGDIFLPPFLAFLLRNLRNKFLLKCLNLLNKFTFNAPYKALINHQLRKNLFYDIPNFKALAQQRYAKYRADNALVIEGHYHQGVIFNEQNLHYVNLPSFAYENGFFIADYE